jgi:hypothetical protein
MMDLARGVWPALAIAFLIGVPFGWLSRAEAGAAWRGRLALAALGFALGVLALSATFDLVPGRAGLWLDSALLHLAAYLLGCGLGWLAAQVRKDRPAPEAEVPQTSG